MSTGEFEQFAAVVSQSVPNQPLSELKQFKRVTILGGGTEACMLAALCLAEEAEVTLFSAYGKELDAIRTRGSITLRGEGPIGSFHVDQGNRDADSPQNTTNNNVAITTTAQIDRAISSAEVIILTGAVHKQRTYAMVLADHLQDNQVVVLPEARTFGCVEMAWLLRVGGCQAQVTLVDIPGMPYWVSDVSGALHLAKRETLAAACLPAQNKDAIQGLNRFFPNLQATHSCLHSAFADGSACVDVPALLLGGNVAPAGGPSVPYGAVPLTENNTFRNLIGDQHTPIIETLWQERCNTARAYGVRDLPDLHQLLDQYAGRASNEGVRAVPNTEQSHALLRSAVIGSLSPLCSAGTLAGVPTPLTKSLIQLSSTLLDGDLQSAGRRLDNMGITANNIDDARRIIDRITSGSSTRGGLA